MLSSFRLLELVGALENPSIIFVKFSNEYGSDVVLAASNLDLPSSLAPAAPGKEGGGFEEVMEEKEGSWMMDSMGGDRKETWAELELRLG